MPWDKEFPSGKDLDKEIGDSGSKERDKEVGDSGGKDSDWAIGDLGSKERDKDTGDAGGGSGNRGNGGISERGIAGAASHEYGGEVSLVYRIATSLLLFGLVAEWLLPWSSTGQWAVIHHPEPLLLVIGCTMIAGLFKLPWGVSLPLNAIICLLAMMLLYKSAGQTGLEWLAGLPSLFYEDVDRILNNGVWAMSGEMRSLMLFTGWSMLAPALQGLMWLRQTALGFAAATIMYLIALHVWLGMDVLGSLIRAVSEGLLLTALMTVPRVRRVMEAAPRDPQRPSGQWIAGSMFLVLVVIGCSLLFTAGRERELAPPKWTVPISAAIKQGLSALGDGSSGVTIKNAGAVPYGQALSGYGFDDSRLGAPLANSDELIFRALTPVRSYWRGEAKSTYDGKGWSNAGGELSLHPIGKLLPNEREAMASEKEEDDKGPSELAKHGVRIEQTILVEHPEPSMPLFAAGGDGRVTDMVAADPRRKLGSYVRNTLQGSLYPPSSTLKVERYTVESTLPVTDELELRRLEDGQEELGAEQESSEPVYDDAITPFLQLPESMPPRVAALAAEVAGGGITSRYDRVMAIQQYLKTSYSYSIENSEMPAEGEDFVDHFLFDQKEGYCVHFSTAMVIMLRTQGIPARWVKGFTSGESAAGTEQELEADGLTSGGSGELLEIKAKDAHAWVEVYFPGAGWVPFDPTPGFDGVATASAAAGFGGGGTLAAAGGASAAGTVSELSLAGLAHGGAAASPAAAAAVGVAALALACAAVLAVRRSRLRLRLALRRYSVACARLAASGADGASVSGISISGGDANASERGGEANAAPSGAGVPALEGAPERAARASAATALPARGLAVTAGATFSPFAAAPAPGRARPPRSRALGEQAVAEQQRAALIAVAAALFAQLRRRAPAPAQQRTAREAALALGAGLQPGQHAELLRLTGWLEEASFGRKGRWQAAPSPEELRETCRHLLAAGKAARQNVKKRVCLPEDSHI